MYNFILIQWQLKKFTADQVNACMTKNYITQDQANTIMETQQYSV
jgi:hypothetical protein